jgi:hypothetical protein
MEWLWKITAVKSFGTLGLDICDSWKKILHSGEYKDTFEIIIPYTVQVYARQWLTR